MRGSGSHIFRRFAKIWFLFKHELNELVVWLLPAEMSRLVKHHVLPNVVSLSCTLKVGRGFHLTFASGFTTSAFQHKFPTQLGFTAQSFLLAGQM